ncbi:MAG: hypothetical protein ABS939_00345 [Psychrobacillus sp.]
MIILNSKYVIEEILKRNNYYNFNVKIITGKNKISRCDFTKEHTTISLHVDDNKADANSLLVASHEACHALNYHEGATNHNLLLTSQKIMQISFLITIAVAFVEFFNSLYNLSHLLEFSLHIVLVLNWFFITLYFIYYTLDEAKTEKRALIELQNIWKENLVTIDFKDIQKINKKTLLWSIYSITAIIIIMITAVLFLAHWAPHFIATLLK